MRYRRHPRPRLWFEFDARELARRLSIPTQVFLEESMQRDTTRAMQRVSRVASILRNMAGTLDEVVHTLTDMDARTGTRDPTKRARPAKRTPARKGARKGATKGIQRRKGGP